MKFEKFISILVLLSLMGFISSSITPQAGSTAQAAPSEGWFTAPFPPAGFQYARHDGVFVPGPALSPWANKVYFLGGRTSPSTELPDIWMFDPVSLTYADTGANVVEDVSNYNGNLIMDDGTGRGPAIYVIGGTDKDHNGQSIGLVQRYYPMTNQAEALSPDDYFNGTVGAYRVAAMGTAVVDDIIYVFGGWETDVTPYFTADTWAFDPNAPEGYRWTNLELPLHTARSYIMSAVQGGKIYSIGGVGFYNGDDLAPVDTFEVLDTANLAAGWTQLAALPAPGGEGRGFGFDQDTLNIEASVQGKLYVVAANDWPDVSGAFWEYDIATNTWEVLLEGLPTPRADMAGSYVPLCTSDPNDGMPGLWTFGGRINESCDPPMGPTEYYSLACEEGCSELTGVLIDGPTLLAAGESGTYTSTAVPEDASAPATVEWSNGDTYPVTHYMWDVPGNYTVEITATNCEGSAVVTGTLEVYVPCTPVDEASIDGPTSLDPGEIGTYTVSWTPITATLPVDILWSNLVTDTVSQYSWDDPGLHLVEVTVENCGGAVSASLEVQVIQTHFPVWLPLLVKAEAR